MRNRLILLVLVTLAALSSACADPCQQLAERICNCERTINARRVCRADRITNRQSSIDPSPEEQDSCFEALSTCTCEALDENRTYLCGYTRQTEPFVNEVDDDNIDDDDDAGVSQASPADDGGADR